MNQQDSAAKPQPNGPRRKKRRDQTSFRGGGDALSFIPFHSCALLRFLRPFHSERFMGRNSNQRSIFSTRLLLLSAM